jgi:hypothetical protein
MVKAIRSGRKEEGRQLLNLLIQQNPNNEVAWLWMSSVVDTDEQRARCLYHVLAINPENQVARKGLQILGIVLTDSRPVKIPRDSQPIKIPKPTSKTELAFPQANQLDSKPVPVQERRPFRLDPKAIVEELPFTPVREPFTNAGQEVQPGQLQTPSQPTQVIGANEFVTTPQESVGQLQTPSEPVPAVQTGTETAGATQIQAQATQAPNPSEPVPVVLPHAGQNSQPPATPQPSTSAGPFHETRPSSPVPVAHSSMTQPMSQPMPVVGPGGQMQYPAGLGVHSNMTVGMPPGYAQTQYPSQPMPAIHSNGTMPMQAYPQPPMQPMMAQGASIHSGATMAMPMGYDPLAALNNMSNIAKPGLKGHNADGEEEDEGEVNILAVIIFGSLSVTALGGLGMLILLMFTAG